MKIKESLRLAIFVLPLTLGIATGCDEITDSADAGPSAASAQVASPAQKEAKQEEAKPSEPTRPELAVIEEYSIGKAGQALRYVSEPDHGNCFAIVGESVNGQFVPRGITPIGMSNCRKR